MTPMKATKVRRGLLAASRTPDRRIVTQDYARDQFGELPARKREAIRVAHAHGHQMGPWAERPNDPFGRWDTWCVDCNRIVTVATEQPPNLALAYGKALTQDCGVQL